MPVQRHLSRAVCVENSRWWVMRWRHMLAAGFFLCTPVRLPPSLCLLFCLLECMRLVPMRCDARPQAQQLALGDHFMLSGPFSVVTSETTWETLGVFLQSGGSSSVLSDCELSCLNLRPFFSSLNLFSITFTVHSIITSLCGKNHFFYYWKSVLEFVCCWLAISLGNILDYFGPS